jgi:hypothetical protein
MTSPHTNSSFTTLTGDCPDAMYVQLLLFNMINTRSSTCRHIQQVYAACEAGGGSAGACAVVQTLQSSLAKLQKVRLGQSQASRVCTAAVSYGHPDPPPPSTVSSPDKTIAHKP